MIKRLLERNITDEMRSYSSCEARWGGRGGDVKERKEEGGGASKMEEGRHERTELTAHHFRGENISSKNIMISSPTKFYVSTCECADGLRNEHTFQGIKNKRPLVAELL